MGAQHPCYFSEVAQQQTTHHHDSYKVSLQHQHSKTHIQYKGVELAIECTYTDPRTGEVFPIAANPDNPDTISVKMIDEGVSQSSLCSRKSFQPGWYDERGMQSWHDVCDRPPVETDSGMSILDMMIMKWDEQACPNLMNKQGGGDMWISIVGDSVTRAVFLNNLRYIEGLKVYRTWEHPDKAGPSTNSDIDFHLKAKAKETKMILAGLEVEPGRNIWFTYTFKYMCDLSASEQFEEIASADDVSGQRFCQGNWNIPQTWADFVSLRNEDLRDDDPIFSGDKIPDAVIISPGYHSSHMNAQTYGLTLGKYLDHLNPDLSVHVSLNMMPASWMIPDLYANDRRLRTQLNEYRKNLAIIETVQQRDSVRSVLDFFSSELIFNDDAHHDAVHLGGTLGRRLNTINDALIIDAVCNN